MTFRRDGDKVTIEMSVNDWEHLLMMLGHATGAAVDNDVFRSWVRLLNILNRTNPDFVHYEMPAKKGGRGE